MNEAVLVSACRTPIGKYLGSLAQTHATDLGAAVVQEALRRGGVPPEAVDDCIMGNVLQAGVGQAPARQAALKAGLPPSVSALTVNKVCGSGLQAVMLADQAIRGGDAEVVVAGGMESMSGAPYLLTGVRQGWKIGDQSAKDAMLYDGLFCPFGECAMGAYAERTARMHKISRQAQDAYALESQRRAATAIAGRFFAAEIVPITVRAGKKSLDVVADEGPRPDTSVEVLGKLAPSFDPEGTVTAGNASMLSDGAAALVVAARATAEKHHWPIMGRIVAHATAGVEPRDLFVAPIFAVRKVLQKASMTAAEIDLFELNEAFAAQMVACIRELDLSSEKVNIHGGAIALGHPIGASGARVLTTLLFALAERKCRFGLASLCLGGGNAVAMIVERV